jgi:hypothetical protein
MIGSAMLGMAVGLALVFLLLSIGVSAFNELAEGLLKRRSRYLHAALERMAGPDVVEALYDTEWIKSLGGYAHSLRAQGLGTASVRGRQVFDRKLPSYIPTDVFVDAVREALDHFEDRAQAAIDKLEAGGTKDEIIELLPPKMRELLPTEGRLTAAELRQEIERLIPVAVDQLRRQFPLGVLENLEGDATRLRQWFETSMDRMSGWYGRQTKWLLLVWGLLFAAVLNIDTFNMARTLWVDDVTRAAVVTAAEGAAQGGEPTDCTPREDDPFSCVDDAIDKIKATADLGLPMGWPAMPWNWGDQAFDDDGNPIPGRTLGDDERIPQGVEAWVYKILGLAITGAAVVVGAPFWFDLLNRLVNFRAAGPKPKATVARTETP